MEDWRDEKEYNIAQNKGIGYLKLALELYIKIIKQA